MATRTADQLLTSHLGLRVTFEADPVYVAEVRHAVRQIAQQLRAAAVAEVLELLVSELTTNGIKASRKLPEFPALAEEAKPDLSVTLLRFPGGVVLSCWDPYWQSMPVPGAAGPDDDHGRGLFLVDALSDRWGVEIDREVDGTARGKVVYAVLLFDDDDEPPASSPVVLPPAPAVEVPSMRCDPAKVGFPQPSLRGVRIQRSTRFDAALGRRVLAGLGAS